MDVTKCISRVRGFGPETAKRMTNGGDILSKQNHRCDTLRFVYNSLFFNWLANISKSHFKSYPSDFSRIYARKTFLEVQIYDYCTRTLRPHNLADNPEVLNPYDDGTVVNTSNAGGYRLNHAALNRGYIFSRVLIFFSLSDRKFRLDERQLFTCNLTANCNRPFVVHFSILYVLTIISCAYRFLYYPDNIIIMYKTKNK